LTGVFVDTQTIVIGGKTYTTQDTLTDVDGNVKIGGTAEACIDNLVAAINLAAGSGTAYAASMTLNQHVTAVKGSATTLVVTAKVAGVIGNYIDSTETQTNASWGAATLASGAGHVYTAVDEILAGGQINSDVQAAMRNNLRYITG
jgi:hypothetical protein